MLIPEWLTVVPLVLSLGDSQLNSHGKESRDFLNQLFNPILKGQDHKDFFKM